MSPEELAARIRGVRFTPVRFREGYDMGQVDELLDEAVRAVESGQPVAGLTAVSLKRVKWREGYKIEEVDRVLERLRSMAP